TARRQCRREPGPLLPVRRIVSLQLLSVIRLLLQRAGLLPVAALFEHARLRVDRVLRSLRRLSHVRSPDILLSDAVWSWMCHLPGRVLRLQLRWRKLRRDLGRSSHRSNPDAGPSPADAGDDADRSPTRLRHAAACWHPAGGDPGNAAFAG